MKNKILIPIIILLVLGGGFFIWHQFIRQPPIEQPPVEEVQVPPVEEEQIVAPRAILRGNIMLNYVLSVDIRQGYIATYDLFHKDEKVGEVSSKRIEPGTIKSVQLINIPGVFFKESIVFIAFCPELLKPKTAIIEGSFEVKKFGHPLAEIETKMEFDYVLNEVRTTSEMNEIVLPTIIDRIVPNTVAKINIQDLDVGLELGDMRVIKIDTVTVPAGTFEVFVIEYIGYITGAETKMTIYVTKEGKLVKGRMFIPGIEVPIVSKLRSYLPKVEKPVFEPDETILAEFCREVITRAQLREITGYEGVFSFEEIIEEPKEMDFFPREKMCEIRTAATLAEVDPSLMIAIFSPAVDYTAEEQFIAKRDMMIVFGVDAREIEGIGKKAFLMTVPEEGHFLKFIDADIDRMVFAGVSMIEFDYEVAINLAKQVEVNLK